MELSKLMGCVKRPFIPSELFRNGLIDGAWFDPSDMTTLYQDEAGTTPVTAVEQPVGLMLDKARGLMLGPELVTNGTFDTDTTGWSSVNGATISVSNGQLVVAPNGVLYGSAAAQSFSTIAGKTYCVKMTCTKIGASPRIRLFSNGAQVGGTFTFSFAGEAKSVYFIATGTTSMVYAEENHTGTTSVSNFDNISVREIYGNHATQSITASRPTLSARYNLLTKTEDFSDSAWARTNCSAVRNYGLSPIGTLTSSLITNTAVSGYFSQTDSTAGTQKIFRGYVKNSSTGWVRIVIASLASGGNSAGHYINTQTGAKGAQHIGGTGYSVASCLTELTADGWVLITLVVNGPNEIGRPVFSIALADGDTNGPVGGTAQVWGFDLRLGTSAGPYQRVDTATDYDTDPRYFPKYLRFDGVDDYMNLLYMGLYANGSASVVMGISRAKAGVVKYALAEGNSAGGNNYIPLRLSDTGISSRIINDAGTVVVLTPESAGSASSLPEVLSFKDTGNTLTLYKNSSQTNLTNYTRAGSLTLNNLTVGAIVQASVAENMLANLYSLIITKSALTDAQRIACERHAARKAGVTL